MRGFVYRKDILLSAKIMEHVISMYNMLYFRFQEVL